MNSDSVLQAMTVEELKRTAYALNNLEKEETWLAYLSGQYEETLRAYAEQEDKVRDMKAQIDSVLVKEV